MQIASILKMEFYKKKTDWKLSKEGTERRKNSSKTTEVFLKKKVSLQKEPDDIPGPQCPDFDPLGSEIPDHPGPEVHSLTGPEVLDLLGPEVLDLLGPEVLDLPGPEVLDLPGPEVLDLPGPEVFDLAGPEVLDLPGPEVLELPGPEVLNLPGPEVLDLPGPEVFDLDGPEVLDLHGPEVSDLPGPEIPDLPGPEALNHNLYRLHSRSCQPNSGDRAEALGQYTLRPNSQPYWQDWGGMETAGTLQELACDQYDGHGQHYLEASGIVDAAGHEWLQEGYPLYEEQFTFLYGEDQGLPKLEIQVFDTPDPRTTAAMSCSIEVPTEVMSEFLDETADFMRGAHLALHSSEIDLNTTQECPCIGKDNLWALSVKQLARAIERHKLSLALLLEEGARRDQLIAHSVPYPRVSFNDRVVICDTNRLQPPGGILPGGDCAPFGSSGTGRGRGRLQQARRQYDSTS